MLAAPGVLSSDLLPITAKGREALGGDVVIARARARIFWRNDKHQESVKILREVADVVGRDNPVDRAFAMREAAISAAKNNVQTPADCEQAAHSPMAAMVRELYPAYQSRLVASNFHSMHAHFLSGRGVSECFQQSVLAPAVS